MGGYISGRREGREGIGMDIGKEKGEGKEGREGGTGMDTGKEEREGKPIPSHKRKRKEGTGE